MAANEEEVEQEYIASDKIFSHLGRLQNYLNEREVEPITVEIHPTNLCNNKCYYCIASRYRNDKTLSGEEMIVIIEKLQKMGVKAIIFSGGGEPFVNPNIMQAIEKVVRLGMDVGIITNGLGIKEEDVPKLVGLCSWIRVSLDTTDREIYEEVRGVDGLEKVIENIRGLVEERKRQSSSCTIGTQTVVTPYNLNGINETARFVRELGADYYQIRPLEGKEPYTTEQINKALSSIVESKSLQTKGFKIVDTMYKWTEIDPRKEIRKNYDKCHILPFNGAVDASGDIYLCCHLVGHKQFCYGNLITDSIEDIFSRRQERMESFWKEGFCEFCPVACRGSLVNQTIEKNFFREKEHKNFL